MSHSREVRTKRIHTIATHIDGNDAFVLLCPLSNLRGAIAAEVLLDRYRAHHRLFIIRAHHDAIPDNERLGLAVIDAKRTGTAVSVVKVKHRQSQGGMRGVPEG